MLNILIIKYCLGFSKGELEDNFVVYVFILINTKIFSQLKAFHISGMISCVTIKTASIQLKELSICPLAAYPSSSVCFPLSPVQSVGFLQQQDKPVNLWSQNRQISHVAVQRQVEGHPVKGNSKLPPVHPVHEGEDQDAAREEAHEDHDAVDSVQPGVIVAQLQVQFCKHS